MKLSDSIIRRNPGLEQQLLDLQAPAESLVTAHEQHCEAQFEKDAERWLEHRGYLRRSKDNIAGGVPPCGWQLHFPQAQGNPLVLDIILLRVDGRYLEIELKTEAGKVKKHQRELWAMAGKLCRTMFELKQVIEEWENKKEAR